MGTRGRGRGQNNKPGLCLSGRPSVRGEHRLHLVVRESVCASGAAQGAGGDSGKVLEFVHGGCDWCGRQD